MWRDICMANRDALMSELQQYAAELYVIHQALESNDATKLEEIFSLAREVRSTWVQK
jgi:prephenate dehydrogenase